MEYIDEKFKEVPPEETVGKIRDILEKIGITLTENWTDSGVENCCSLRVCANGTSIGTNGKGITRAFAAASGYGEFMERLQSGLFFYKYQSLERDPELFLHTYAPDARYMTRDELIENGAWMDPIIETFGGSLSREALADQCLMYAESDPVLTLPYYSIFEDKYVYLPAGFVEHVYSANGSCVGNTREEAWVHALSEILERHSTIHMITSGKPAPALPEARLDRFPTVKKILSQLRENQDLDIAVLDFSDGLDFPVVATRIIRKSTQGYLVNVGADPVLEIAVERTLTEIFQGRTLKTFDSAHSNKILNRPTDIRPADNVLNQLETGNGLFTADFFTETPENTHHLPDYSDKTNRELIAILLELFRKIGKPVYVRNHSFLGFPCYRFIVPGYSESRGLRLTEPLQLYAFGSSAAKTLRYIERASDEALQEVLLFHRYIANIYSRANNFWYLCGIPVYQLENSLYLTGIHLAYAAHRLGNTAQRNQYLLMAKRNAKDDSVRQYVACLLQYFDLTASGISEERSLQILQKFHPASTYETFVANRNRDALFDGLLLRCDTVHCDGCAYRDACEYRAAKDMIRRAGEEYRKFTDGQAKEHVAF